MRNVDSYKRGVKAIRKLMADRQYAEALAKLRKLLDQWPDQPVLLVLQGELIQLQEDTESALDDAQRSLKRATDLDEHNGDAWLELAHYQFAVEDDAQAAARSFARAVNSASQTLIAALLGHAAALEELGDRQKAFDCLSTAKYLQTTCSTKNGSAFVTADLYDRWESLVGNV